MISEVFFHLRKLLFNVGQVTKVLLLEMECLEQVVAFYFISIFRLITMDVVVLFAMNI